MKKAEAIFIFLAQLNMVAFFHQLKSLGKLIETIPEMQLNAMLSGEDSRE